MPIYQLPDVSGSRHDDYLPEIERFRTMEEMGTSIHFNEEKPLEGIRQYISGMRWEVEYFSQYQGTNEDNNPLDINTSVANQSYIRIHKLILFVNNALNQSGIRDLSGSALVNADFTPVVGDQFMTTLVGGRIALFTVTSVTKNDYNLHQVHEIEYKLERNLNEDVEAYNNLMGKVVRNYVYNNDAGIDGTTRLLTREEVALVDDIKSAISDLTDYYFRMFIDPETKFLKLPNEKSSTLSYVDQELCKFCRAVFSVEDYPDVVNIQCIDYTMDKTVRYTIWDVLRRRDYRLITRAEPFLGFTRSPYPRSNLNSLEPRWMDVDFIIDKVQKIIPNLPGIEDTRTYVDPRVDVYQILRAIQNTDSKNKSTAMKTWDIIIPGMDFTTVPINKPEARVVPPTPEPEPKKPVFPKTHNESKPLAASVHNDDKEACDQCVKSKVEEMEKKDLESLKKTGKIVPPVDIGNSNGNLPSPTPPTPPTPRPTPTPPSPPIKSTIQPIRSTKQYQRFASKKETP